MSTVCSVLLKRAFPSARRYVQILPSFLAIHPVTKREGRLAGLDKIGRLLRFEWRTFDVQGCRYLDLRGKGLGKLQ